MKAIASSLVVMMLGAVLVGCASTSKTEGKHAQHQAGMKEKACCTDGAAKGGHEQCKE